MRRCIFCGCRSGVVLWELENVADHAVPACRSCGEEHGLRALNGWRYAAVLPDYRSCQCCGRELAEPGGWPATVWFRDRGRLMAVCNACRVEYALRAVFTSAPPPRRAHKPPSEPGGLGD